MGLQQKAHGIGKGGAARAADADAAEASVAV